ncbi:MAG: AAA family ATPase [Phycisphaerales bacterium]|nr:AAA family ATPase [Phycisphaerales bacterium]
MNIAPPNVTAIPSDLRSLPQWVVWQAPKKIPYTPGTGQPASSGDPATWRTFGEATACYEAGGYAGIGFVFTPGDPYCGIDLDDCLDVGGIPYPKAWAMIEKLGSYAEISPSGRGVKVIARARKIGGKCKAPFEWERGAMGQIEIYDSARYFTVTGNVLPDTPPTINERQQAVARLYRYLFPEARAARPVTGNAADRAWAYLVKCPDSISGQGGHDRFLRAACECMRFGLSDADTLDLLRRWSLEKSGGEPWNEREVAHKVASARDKCGAAGEIGMRLRESRDPVPLTPPPKAGASSQLRDRLEKVKSGEYAAAPWPWPMTEALTQAFLPGAVTMLCAAAGTGKTFWILGLLLGWLELGVDPAVFMLEEDRAYFLQRTLAILEGESRLTDQKWTRANAGAALDAERRHRATLDRIGGVIYDAPAHRVSLPELADWYESVASSARVAVIDPVTAASTGDKRWIEDGNFIERVKRIGLDTGASLLLVTHPRIGTVRKGPPTLDDLTGGSDYPKFTQTVIVMADHDPEEQVQCRNSMGTVPGGASANRMLYLRKTRNGRGQGMKVAFTFDPRTLRFHEHGLVVK